MAQRADVDAGRVHVEDQQRDALVLRQGRIRAHVAEALLRDRRVRRPDLLPVDDEVVVEHFGAGLQAGEVGAGVRLAHADAPDRVAPDRARRHRVCVVVAELEQARRDDRIAGEVSRARDAPARQRLEVDERLHRRAVPAAELGRVAGDHPPVVEERRLPVAHPLRHQLVVVADVALEVEAARALPPACARRGSRRDRRETPRLRAPKRAAPCLQTASDEPDACVRNGS